MTNILNEKRQIDKGVGRENEKRSQKGVKEESIGEQVLILVTSCDLFKKLQAV